MMGAYTVLAGRFVGRGEGLAVSDDRADERLLPGEDPASVHPDDAAHWVTVYSELVGFLRARGLVAVAVRRYERRLAFWWGRLRELDAERAAALWEARSQIEREAATRGRAGPQREEDGP
jgi:hypothetical protein